MSRNKKYIEQFDRNAGKPSDFESLFHFEKGQLMAKRRIRVRSTRSRIAAMCSAAAVIGIAALAALAYINTKGIASDTVMSRTTGDVSPELTAYIEESSQSAKLSSFIDSFEYEVTGDLSGNNDLLWDYSSDSETQGLHSTDWQAVIRFRVASKKYANGKIVYNVKPLEFFAEEDYSAAISNYENETITFSVPVYDLRELQTGKEYIMPFLAYGLAYNDIIFYADDTGYFAEKTDKGWLIYNCGRYYSDLMEAMEAGTEEVFDDMIGTGSYHLEPSDEKMDEKIINLLVSEKGYYHMIFDSSTVQLMFEDILPGAEFEKVRYAVNEREEPDRTLLILDNEQYYSLMPHISGNVVFAGTSLNGEKCAAVEIEYNGEPMGECYCHTILMSGFTELYVSTGDGIDENSVIGICDSEPVYMQFIDNNGAPIEIEFSYDISEETVPTAEADETTVTLTE